MEDNTIRTHGVVFVNGREMRQVPGYDRYAVNVLGLVYDFKEEVFVISTLDEHGYALLRLKHDRGNWINEYAHIFSAKAWLLNTKRRKNVGHNNLITDNSHDNLFWKKGSPRPIEREIKSKSGVEFKCGEEHPRFKGWYITEFGKFDNLGDVALAHNVNKSTMKRRFDKGMYQFIEKKTTL
jgi:hypothetical protein